jgi:hypothetical protein
LWRMQLKNNFSSAFFSRSLPSPESSVNEIPVHHSHRHFCSLLLIFLNKVKHQTHYLLLLL